MPEAIIYKLAGVFFFLVHKKSLLQSLSSQPIRNADWFLNNKIGWKHFRCKLFKMDAQDFRPKILIYKILYHLNDKKRANQ